MFKDGGGEFKQHHNYFSKRIIASHPFLVAGVFLSPISLLSVFFERKKWFEGNTERYRLSCDVLPPPDLLKMCLALFLHILTQGIFGLYFLGYKFFIGGCAVKFFLCRGYSILVTRNLVVVFYGMSPYKTIYLCQEM